MIDRYAYDYIGHDIAPLLRTSTPGLLLIFIVLLCIGVFVLMRCAKGRWF